MIILETTKIPFLDLCLTDFDQDLKHPRISQKQNYVLIKRASKSTLRFQNWNVNPIHVENLLKKDQQT